MKALSGGERNRLLLARLFTRPANVLVLDEPTNDLDLETLELLEEELVDWPGTLLLVSHDRAFLDNVVTSTIVFEGDGVVQEYVGGYEDWLRQRRAAQVSRCETRTGCGIGAERAAADRGGGGSGIKAAPNRKTQDKKKLSYKEQRELDALPARIEALESGAARSSARIAAPAFLQVAARRDRSRARARRYAGDRSLPTPTRAGTRSNRATGAGGYVLGPGAPSPPQSLSTPLMVAVAVEFGLIALLLTGFAAVLSPFTALGHHALAGRMRAFLRVCHREPPGFTVSLTVPSRKLSLSESTAEV